MEKILTVIMLVIFIGVMIGVGMYSLRHASDVNGFVLGGRGVGPWLTAFAFGTSYFSAVIFVGYAGQFGWLFGLAATWAGLGNAFIGSLLAWNVLGRRTRVMSQHLDAKTMPDFFGKRFNSTPLKVVASLIVFVFLIPYTASLYNGLSSLFGLVFNIPYWVVILVMAVLTGVYVIFGGYMATAINDFIQGIIMLIGIVAVILAVLSKQGGLLSAMQKLSEVPAEGWSGGAFSSFFGPDPVFLFFVVILTSLGTWGLPQMVGKFYAIKSENDIHKGTVISTVFAIIVAGGCYFLGGFGRLYADSEKIAWALDAEGNKTKPLFDTIIPAMLSELAPVIIAVVIVLVLSASMSTLSSLVLASSSTFTLDVIKPAFKKAMSEKKQVTIMRVFIVFFILVSAVIAVIKDANPSVTFIAQMMGVSWGGLAGAFLAPYLYGLYWKGVTKASTVVCFIWGTALAITQFVISMTMTPDQIAAFPGILSLVFKTSIHSGVFAMVGGLIIVPIVSLITPKMNKKDVDGHFSCFDKTYTAQVTAKERIEEAK